MVYKGNMLNIESIAAQEIPRLLGQWLDGPVETEFLGWQKNHKTDVVIRTREFTLAIEVKGTDDIAVLKRGCHQLESYTREMEGAILVLAVPYMGPKARAYAEDRGLSWLDLSGNADIRGPGLRILVQGNPNRFASPGRPSTVFSPKASRLSRAMLVEPLRRWLQAELVDTTQLSAGYVSKVMGRLVEDGLVLHPQQLERHPLALQLAVDVLEVGLGPILAAPLARVEQPLQGRVVHRLGQRPAQPRGLGPHQATAHRGGRRLDRPAHLPIR